jgi:hypothetical protein
MDVFFELWGGVKTLNSIDVIEFIIRDFAKFIVKILS